MELTIRRAAETDTDELTALYDEVIDHLAATTNYPGWQHDEYPTRQTAEQGIEEGNLYVAEADGKLAGTLILRHTPEQAYRGAPWQVEAADEEMLVVYTFTVSPRFSGQGVGRALLEFAAEFARRQGMKALRLDVTDGNVPAIRLYERCGFRYIATVDLGLADCGLPWFRLYERLL